jgi:hypothetical protein
MEGKAYLIFIGVLEHQGNERNSCISVGGLLENSDIRGRFLSHGLSRLSMPLHLNNQIANHMDYAFTKIPTLVGG